MPYPKETGFTAGNATSEYAAKDFDKRGASNKQREFAEDFLRSRGALGATGEEMRKAFVDGGFETMERAQASARLSDLCALEPPIAYATKAERVSDVTGKPQQVVVHKDYATEEEKNRPREKSLREEIRDDIEMAANFLNGLIKSKAIDGAIWGKRAGEIEEMLRNHVTKLGKAK